MQTLQPFDLPLLRLPDSLQELWSFAMTFPNRWQDCEAFIEALLQRKYVTRDADGNVGPLMADGIYLYMYELWQDGHNSPVCAACKNVMNKNDVYCENCTIC